MLSFYYNENLLSQRMFEIPLSQYKSQIEFMNQQR